MDLNKALDSISDQITTHTEYTFYLLDLANNHLGNVYYCIAMQRGFTHEKIYSDLKGVNGLMTMDQFKRNLNIEKIIGNE